MLKYTELIKDDIETLIERKSITCENGLWIIRFYKRYIMYKDGDFLKNDDLLIMFKESIVEDCHFENKRQIHDKFISQLRIKTKN